MGLHKIRKGLNLPIAGAPKQTIEKASQPNSVAVLADDYVGIKPTMHVAVGDDVCRGQVLFEDKKNPGVRFTAPGSGRVIAVHRGARRALQSVVIQLDTSELAGKGEAVTFSSFTGRSPGELQRTQVKDLLLESGLWTALRGRPFGRVADPEKLPRSIFVTASDTNPLSPDVNVVLGGKEEHFERGLQILAKLTDGPVYICKSPGGEIPVPSGRCFKVEEFSGPHPSGTVGVHIHFLDPVDATKLVWHVDYQDTVAIGALFESGVLDVERVVALAGPSVNRPRLLSTRIGASVDRLTTGELSNAENRVISGSVFSGRIASGDVFGYLGRYHHQISAIPEQRTRTFLGWLTPGIESYSIVNTFISRLIPNKKFNFGSSTHGSNRAMVPIGMYERIMPMDIQPSFLLRALAVGDIEYAQQLGCLELDEEDLALCTFVCPGKTEYGPLLRNVLTAIEKEG